MPKNIQELIQIMNDMIQLEEALADLYQECSEKFPEDNKFYLAICHQEKLHAKLIRDLGTLIAAHPNEFKFGRPFNAVAIATILKNVKNSTEQIRLGRLDRQRALFLAKDIENSVLEAKYHEIVITDNVEFKEVLSRIMKDTSSHKNLLSAKVASGHG